MTTTENGPSLSTVADLVQRHYGQEIWQAIKAGIGVVASMSLKKRDHCLVLIYEGASGHGKSIAVRVFMPYAKEGDDNPAHDKLFNAEYLHRVDDFTPASFVSHAANRKTTELPKLDLLPKIKDKVMLTKELAPIFWDDEKELRNNFARLTSILDGNGFMSASGSHGWRGYQERSVFNWLGATTPIPDRTHKIMAQLGNRLPFFHVEGVEPTEDELVDFASSYGGSDAVKECQATVNEFISAYFRKHRVETIEPEEVEIQPDLRRELVRLARLICNGRVELDHSDIPGGGFEVGKAEGPQRVILLLQTLARGLALAHDRFFVTAEDTQLIRHIALSSIPRKRRDVLNALLSKNDKADAGEIQRALRLTRPTTLSWMAELGATGIAIFVKGEATTSTPATLTLSEEWKWLLNRPP